MDIRRLCLVWVLSASAVALAQEGRSDVSLSVLANLPRRSQGNALTIDSTNSGGGSAAYRLYFGTHSTAEVTYAFTRATYYYKLDESAVHGGIIGLNQLSNLHEITGQYVYRFWQEHRFKPFAFAGGGVIIFKPVDSRSNTLFGGTTQARGAALFGGGVDYPFKARFSFRAQCRLVTFKAPDFFGAGVTSTSRMMHITPQIGVVYHF